MLPCYYLPSINFVEYAVQHKDFCFDVEADFIKQSYRNRAEIVGANGIQKLIIPIKDGRKKQLLKDTKISYLERWDKVHVHAIKSAYASSPFYEHIETEISQIISSKPEFLLDLNQQLWDLILKTLKIYPEKHPKKMENISKKITENASEFQYQQVFELRHGFIKNLSVLDVICNDLLSFRQYLSKIA